MNRIDEKFEKLRAENKKAFIPYISAGDPSLEVTEQIVYALEEAGADIIELGVPYSDPLADGKVIQAAGLRSLGNGFKIDKLFDTITNIRKKSEVPIAIMVYYSSILGYGVEKFVTNCAKAGVDGLIIPDLPYEEYDEIEDVMKENKIYMIPLVAITSNDRLPMLLEKAQGFVYCVSSLGTTGAREEFDTRVDNFVHSVRAISKVPACVGFGISNREDVERFERVADGVIVGTAIVKKIFECNANLDEIKSFVREMKGN